MCADRDILVIRADMCQDNTFFDNCDLSSIISLDCGNARSGFMDITFGRMQAVTRRIKTSECSLIAWLAGESSFEC